MKTTVWGNPYTHKEHSRTSYGKKDLRYGYAVCDWCGYIRRRVYSYNGNRKLFCNARCYESYHGRKP